MSIDLSYLFAGVGIGWVVGLLIVALWVKK